MRDPRWPWPCVGGALWCLLFCVPASADEVLLRFDTKTDHIVVAEVDMHETGATDGKARESESKVVVLSRYRPAPDDMAWYDEYDLGGSVRVTVNGEPILDSQVTPTLGTCETMLLTPTGYVLKRMSPRSDPDPVSELNRLVENALVELPADPLKPGDRWERPTTISLGASTASVLLSWSLERLEEREGRQYAILHCVAEATVTDLQGAPRAVAYGEHVGQTRRDLIHEYSLTDDCTMTWDVKAGHAVAEQGTMSYSGRITIEYIGPDGLVVATKPDVLLDCKGQRTLKMRPPTDEELALAAAFALPNSVARFDDDLLMSVAAEGLDVPALARRFAPLSQRFATIEATPSNVRCELTGDTGTVTYDLALVGTVVPEGHALDVGEIKQTVEGHVTVGVVRGDSLWRVRSVDWQPAG